MANTSASRASKAQASTSKRRLPRRRTTLSFTWRDIALKITVTEDAVFPGNTQLELIVVKPKGAPVPITSSGYYCHYMPAELLAANGGPVAFFADWLDREARTKRWQAEEFRWRQGDLFAKPTAKLKR
jgi:hypothetical protein